MRRPKPFIIIAMGTVVAFLFGYFNNEINTLVTPRVEYGLILALWFVTFIFLVRYFSMWRRLKHEMKDHWERLGEKDRLIYSLQDLILKIKIRQKTKKK